MTEIIALSSSDHTAWTPEEKAVVEAAGLVFTHTYGAREGERDLAPRAVIEKFRHVARTTQLDPMMRQIYCIGRLTRGVVEWSIQTSIDGFRLIAERSQKYAGQDEAEWLTDSGEWVTVFLKSKHGAHPLAARVKVYRHDWQRPAVGIATWEEYAQTKANGGLTQMWEQRGPGQLAKCAEALALRKAFPQDLSGLYTGDEMTRADMNADQAPAQQQQQQQPTVVEPDAQQAPQQRAERPQADIVDAEIAMSEDWVGQASAATSSDEVLAVYRAARLKGELVAKVDVTNEAGEVVQTELGQWLIDLGTALKAAEVAGDTGTPAVLDEPSEG